MYKRILMLGTHRLTNIDVGYVSVCSQATHTAAMLMLASDNNGTKMQLLPPPPEKHDEGA